MQSAQLKFHKINILLFFNLLLMATSTHPMDLLSLFFSHKAMTPEKQANIFIKEFPIMTFKNAYQRYKKCSPEAQTKINHHFSSIHDDLLQHTFRLATELPPEIHNAVALAIFDSNQALSIKFLLSPIKDSYLLYAWAKNVFEGKEFIPSSFQIKSINLIFKLSDGVKRAVEIVENHQNNPSFCIGKNDIAILHTIAMNSAVGYSALKTKHFNMRYHRQYTLDDFTTSMIISAILTTLSYVPLTIIFGSRKIDLRWCKKTVIDPVLESKTEELTQLIQKSGKLHLLDAICNPQDNLAYPLREQLKKNSPFFCLAPIPAVLDYALSPRDARVTFWASLAGIATATILWTLSYLPFEKFPGGFFGIYIAIPAFWFSLVPLLHYMKHTQWYTEKIDWFFINQKLTDNSFVTPQESW